MTSVPTSAHLELAKSQLSELREPEWCTLQVCNCAAAEDVVPIPTASPRSMRLITDLKALD